MKTLRVLSLAVLALTALSVHAQTPISALPDAGPITGAELVPAVQGGVTTKTNPTDLADFAVGRLRIDGLFDPQGSWSFENGSTSAVPSVRVSNNTPQLELSLASGAADAKRWNWGASTNSFTFRALNDAGTTPSNIYTVTRSAGTATEWDFSIPMGVLQNTGAMPKMRAAMKLPGTQQDAPTTLGAASTYLGIGGGEWNLNSYRGIGFGYIGAVGNEYPAIVGYQETATSSNTLGDLVFATRPSTSNVAPTINLRVRADGAVVAQHVSGTTSPALMSQSTNPQVELWNTGGGTDAKRWNTTATATDISYRICNDAGNSCQQYLGVARSGAAVTSMTFGNTGNNPAFHWNGTGAWTVGGSTGTAGQVLTSNGSGTAPTWQAAGGGGGGTTTGTFTATWTNACSTNPTQNWKWSKTGTVVTITALQSVSCTSDASVFSTNAAALPVDIRPDANLRLIGLSVRDNGVNDLQAGCLRFETDGTMHVHRSQGGATPYPCGGSSWTSSGNKEWGVQTDGGANTTGQAVFTYDMDMIP